MSKEVIVVKLPECDFCTSLARYDALMKDGRWANMCCIHYMAQRMFTQLGTGKGQMLMTQKDLAIRSSRV